MADPEIEIGSGNSLITTSETITSDDFTITDTLELAREKLSRCCERQTATKTSSSQTAWCLVQEHLYHDFKVLRNFLVDSNATLLLDLTCRQELSTVASQLIEAAKIARAQASIRSTNMVVILHCSNQLGKLTTVLSGGRGSKNPTTSPAVCLLLCSSLFPVRSSGERLSSAKRLMRCLTRWWHSCKRSQFQYWIFWARQEWRVF